MAANVILEAVQIRLQNTEQDIGHEISSIYNDIPLLDALCEDMHCDESM